MIIIYDNNFLGNTLNTNNENILHLIIRTAYRIRERSGASVSANQGVAGSSPGPATYFRGDLS